MLQEPHRKIYRKYATKNPQEIFECCNENDDNVIIFGAIVEENIAIVQAFIDEEARWVLVDGACDPLYDALAEHDNCNIDNNIASFNFTYKTC